MSGSIPALQPTSGRQLTTTRTTQASAGGQPVEALLPVAALAAVSPHQGRPAGLRLPSPAASPQPFFEPGLQADVAGAQQGQAWLKDMGRQLDGLKQSLAGLLIGGHQAGNTAGNAAEALRQVQSSWNRRSSAAGGTVDGQLRVTSPGQARQAFTLRGLDLAALTDEGPETLSFAVPGVAQAITVAIDPDEAAHAQVQRLGQSLAPAGVRAALVDGQLRFDASEAQWPALREGLSVKGDGRRFPSGQRVRVRLEPQADGLQPGQWNLEGSTAQRQTLSRVIAAQVQLDKTAAALRAQTAAASLPEPVDAEARGEAMLKFAREFKAGASEPSYGYVAELAPALKGMARERVRALLLQG